MTEDKSQTIEEIEGVLDILEMFNTLCDDDDTDATSELIARIRGLARQVKKADRSMEMATLITAMKFVAICGDLIRETKDLHGLKLDQVLSEDDIKAIRDATVVFETAITGSVTHAMETIDKLDVWKSGGRIDKMVEESAEYLPKIGTFEWVLARVRHGAEYSQFRRRGWAEYGSDAMLDMSVPGPAAIINTRYPAYDDAYIRMLDASDMTADDWEEVD